MWNSYWSGRSRRDLPQVDYRDYESSDEDDFQSPARPPVSRAGSPPLLAVPQLNDNVDEDLEKVNQTLRNVGHTPLFRKVREEDFEIEESGFVIQKAEVDNLAPARPIMAARYDTLDEEDVGDVYSKSSTLCQPFRKEDPKVGL